MKFCIINAHLPSYDAMAALTTYGNRTEYAKLHGYDLLVYKGPWTMPACHPVSWDRLRYMREVVASGVYDWCYCCGVDTLHTNMTIGLERFTDEEHHMVVSSEWCSPIQADSFLVKSSESGIAYLDDILSMYSEYKDNPWVEQQAMIDSLPKHRSIVKLLPQRALNSYNYSLFLEMYSWEDRVRRGVDMFGNDGNWAPGDFLIHWPSLPLEVRIREINKTLPLVVR